MTNRARATRGFTLIELVVATAILAILAASAMPLFEVSVRREREIELRHGLRQIRRAIDLFHESYVASGGATAIPGAPPVAGQPPGGGQRPRGPAGPGGAPQPPVPLIDVSKYDPIDSKGYPPHLKELVEGVQASGGGTDEKDLIKFLRRVPRDPMLPQDQIDSADPNFGWGARAYQDAPDSRVWGRQNVWDVFSKSHGTALDGSKYRDW